MSETSIVQLLERVGFPIFVAVWFLLRLEKKLEAMVDAMNRMSKVHADVLLELDSRADGVPTVDLNPENSRRRRLPTRGEP